eukprot:NODE_8250_length_294_cov_19.763265_g7510_i0.p3 GENE.NODE_8250_length_294_cov_19.763265_g7510_i0~~NODE_8250_length_294_cov_19.763265_g7510_i0.p3  ORF type:complete len:55 (+),score=24.19 NODE_8250_length_294_cov_19.763265_g7510_i0:128-292(+)
MAHNANTKYTTQHAQLNTYNAHHNKPHTAQTQHTTHTTQNTTPKLATHHPCTLR